jgi:amino acid transporter/nucleotide-binding universal stress UspA family protein
MTADDEHKLGLFGATSVGVGAIVGGGILALAGVAFAEAGPSAIIAFALNGVIAMLTALTFAEMASRFPESGGTYTFSKKVLSVEAAFTVGWVVWFASIVAAVLYALGFAHFAIVFTSDLLGDQAPAWVQLNSTKSALAILTSAGLAVMLTRKSGGGGAWINVAKVIVFSILIAGGLWAVFRQPVGDTRSALKPFFSGGSKGLIVAMGYSFIALQGFDLIAAAGGEVRNPRVVLPRAMVISLVIALLIYLPLLFVISTVGVGPSASVQQEAANNPEGIVAIAARNFLGPFGYWLVIVAAVLSMFSALQANLFAASRIARAMALDRTLPAAVAKLNRVNSPIVAIAVTTALAVVTLIVVPDVAAAGAASSLIFLITFALAHWISILMRMRGTRNGNDFQTPLFPAVPVIGGVACIGLAIFQGASVPKAGMIASVWLVIGAALFMLLFASRARLRDSVTSATNPELLKLRGRSPLTLVPVANPDSALGLITLANSLVPQHIGRVVLQNIVVAPVDWNPAEHPEPIDRAQSVMRQLLTTAAQLRIRAEALTTVSSEPLAEIARVASLHQCQSVVMGLSNLTDSGSSVLMQQLLGAVNADVVVLRAAREWRLETAENILVPMAGRGGNHYLLARLLGSLSREQVRRVTFMRVLPLASSDADVRREEKAIHSLADDLMRTRSEVLVIRDADPVSAIAAATQNHDLIILGAQRIGRRGRLFGTFIKDVSTKTDCALIVISNRI